MTPFDRNRVIYIALENFYNSKALHAFPKTESNLAYIEFVKQLRDEYYAEAHNY
jgi:hypothetical protein